MKIVVIADASKGKGRVIAKNFQCQGWCVINVSQQLLPFNKVINIQCDFSKPMKHAVCNVFKRYLKKASHVFFVLHSARMFDGQQEDNIKQLCPERLLSSMTLIYRDESPLEKDSLNCHKQLDISQLEMHSHCKE